MCVHSLPDDCLFLVFDRVPLLDLLRLDQICPRWASLLPSACARRHTLVLIGGGTPLDEMDFMIPFDGDFGLTELERNASITFPFFMPHNTTFSQKSFDEFLLDGDEKSQGFFDILYRTTLDGTAETDLTEIARFYTASLSGKLVTYLTNLFPNMNNLVVIHAECFEDELHSVIYLVGSWSLKILKLWLQLIYTDPKYAYHPKHQPARTLMQSINQQCALQQVTLDIDADLRYEDNHPIHYRMFHNPNVFDLPVECYSFVAQLKVVRLFVGMFDHRNSIWNIVHLFDSAKLSQICLGNGENPDVQVALTPKFEFTPKVAQLYNRQCLLFKTVEQFGEFCWRFSGLTVLQMHWTPNIKFVRLVTNLATLKQLTRLKLNIDFEDHPWYPFALVDRSVSRVEGGDDEEPEIVSLPQVKNLVLNIKKRSHLEFESLSKLVFPSVEQILLYEYDDFALCKLCGRSGQSECRRMLNSSLMHKFTSTSVRLYATNEFDEWTEVEDQYEDWW